MVLQMAANGEEAALLYTPAGNEPPDVAAHIISIAQTVGWPLVCPKAPTLFDLIEEFNALPNHRQRWCTRRIKIEPCIALLKQNPGATLVVGLRADEDRQGLYGNYATYRYPLQEAGVDLAGVHRIVEQHNVCVPKRTDCMLCYAQRIKQWYDLWRTHPTEFNRGERLEAAIGHTFRSPSRDTWPTALKDLRVEFSNGRKMRRSKLDDSDVPQACRVCRM